ncbi:class I SAM-dependent methyltransferase [Abyssalbus ytuae]|uniref:Class I SAM-dependent methyltransferase n=1 Tax=Abyssalbus ytuae TaxID=2926907 RepID=A0A9E6ZZS1_9FLAO|nr:class I SAM-dependent methyltransferase [Abyssalbus ytuae]UOB18157.1 class I SAM-dependent methyltransferase [Abyssalbus ytuae]
MLPWLFRRLVGTYIQGTPRPEAQNLFLIAHTMAEFWESNFKDKQAMWGFEPAGAAVNTLQLFQKKGLNKILIPGFGYGRNARIFTDNGFEVTGIEISETAIDIAKKHYGSNIKVFHGPVGNMPYNNESYDGIFCYALIHLLSEKDRAKLINDCYNQLTTGGYMVFVAISVNDVSYGKGELLSKDTFLSPHGVTLFFYNHDSITHEFGKYGLVEAIEIKEPVNKPSQTFWQIVCKRK